MAESFLNTKGLYCIILLVKISSGTYQYSNKQDYLITDELDKEYYFVNYLLNLGLGGPEEDHQLHHCCWTGRVSEQEGEFIKSNGCYFLNTRPHNDLILIQSETN